MGRIVTLMKTTTNKPGYATMAKNLRKDLLEAEVKADRTQRMADMIRVVALREELSRVELGYL
jgi:hypothetical protein